LFSHDSLDAARDFWPNSQSLILILKDYHYNAEKIISKEDISKLSLIEDEIKVLVNESSHYYLVKRFTKGGDLWKIDPLTNCPTTITNIAEFWKRLASKNPDCTEVFELKMRTKEELIIPENQNNAKSEIELETKMINLIEDESSDSADSDSNGSVKSESIDELDLDESDYIQLKYKKISKTKQAGKLNKKNVRKPISLEPKFISKDFYLPVIRNFEAFCKKMMVSTMPFNTSVICTYLNWLAFDCNYSLSYIKRHKNVLIRYYEVKHNYKILPNELLEIAECCKQIKKEHQNKNQGFGKAPCTYEELKHILKSIPKNFRR
jgi:6-pyruvoyl-tetrahydropterin synthase